MLLLTHSLAALTTSSFRDPQGTTKTRAACDLSLPMLSKLRLRLSFPLSPRYYGLSFITPLR